MSAENELWGDVNLEEIGDIYCGQSVSASEINVEGLGHVYITGPEQWDGRSFHLNKWTCNPRKLVPDGCIFITVKGSGIGKIFIGIKSSIGRDIYAFKPSRELELDFVFRAVRHGIKGLIANARGDIPGLSRDHLAKYRLPVPPVPEQRRIVAKLDALTARLASARAELDRVPVLARKLRERAVRSGFRGSLTEVWRQKHASRHAGAVDGLPNGWKWMSLEQLADIKSGMALGKKRPSNAALVEVPYLRVANVQRGSLDLSVVKRILVTKAEMETLRLRPHDILLNEGGDRDKLGRGWVWEGQIPDCIHQNHVFRARLRDSRNSAVYVSLYANEFGQDYFLEHGTQTTNLASISKTKISALPVPMAPPDEQGQIVRRLQAIFARAGRLEAEAARARTLIDRLESAILAKAFRGELVPQDPSDEPASVLLERIRAERAAQGQQSGRAARGRPKKRVAAT